MRILTIIAIPVMLMLTLGLVSSQEKISRADRTHMRETRETMRSVALSLRTLQQMSEDGAYPTELKALVENKLAESVPKDGWGRDFAYQRSADGDFELTSWGADGKAGGDGAARDIVWTAQGELRKMSSEEKEAMGGMLKTLVNTQIRIKMSEAENLYFFSLIQNFENAKELNEGQDALGMLQSLGQGKAESDPTQETMMKLMTGQNPTYSLKKKEFRISRPASDMSQMSEEEKESMQMMQMFMGAIEYEYVIHFPKKVKKVNLKEAEIVDGNTVRIKAPMPKMGEKNEPFELIVKFK